MEVAILLFFTIYLILVVVLIVGWRKAVRTKENASPQRSASLISVIVPVRNEAINIPVLLRSLASQRYSAFEVIIVDDHSTDSTREYIDQNGSDNVRVISNPGHGKKSAITAGICHAHGEIVATTDADCEMAPGWLSAINHAFADERVQLSFGAVHITGDSSFFSKLQSMEFNSLIGSGAAMSALNFPIMCNGANLAYRKNVFLELKGFDGNEHIASGDDEFFMRKTRLKYRDGVKFDGSVDRIVSTAPANDIQTFVHQRLRWASKWKHNTSLSAIAVAVFVLIVQLATIAVGVIAIAERDIIFGSLFGAKMLLEALFLYRVSSFLRTRWNPFVFLTLQIIYPFYVLFIGVISNFLSFQWKGRANGMFEKASDGSQPSGI